jgi:hypothetical protein
MASQHQTEEERHRQEREMFRMLASPVSGLFQPIAGTSWSGTVATSSSSETVPGTTSRRLVTAHRTEINDPFLPVGTPDSITSGARIPVRLPTGILLQAVPVAIRKLLVDFDFSKDITVPANLAILTDTYMRVRADIPSLPANLEPAAAQANMLFSIRNGIINAVAVEADSTSMAPAAADTIIVGPTFGHSEGAYSRTRFDEYLDMEVARDRWASSMFYKAAHHEGSLGYAEGSEPPHLAQLVDPLRATLSRYPLTRVQLKRLMDFENPIKIQDYHPDAASRPLVGVRLGIDNLTMALRKVHGIAFEAMGHKLNAHCSQRVVYFMDPTGGAPQAPLYLEYANEVLRILVAEVVSFFEMNPWSKRPQELARAVFLQACLPQPGEPKEFEDKQRLKDIIDRAAKAIADGAIQQRSSFRKRQREEETLGDRERPREVDRRRELKSIVGKFPFGIDLAAVRTTELKARRFAGSMQLVDVAVLEVPRVIFLIPFSGPHKRLHGENFRQ